MGLREWGVSCLLGRFNDDDDLDPNTFERIFFFDCLHGGALSALAGGPFFLSCLRKREESFRVSSALRLLIFLLLFSSIWFAGRLVCLIINCCRIDKLSAPHLQRVELYELLLIGSWPGGVRLRFRRSGLWSEEFNPGLSRVLDWTQLEFCCFGRLKFKKRTVCCFERGGREGKGERMPHDYVRQSFGCLNYGWSLNSASGCVVGS